MKTETPLKSGVSRADIILRSLLNILSSRTFGTSEVIKGDLVALFESIECFIAADYFVFVEEAFLLTFINDEAKRFAFYDLLNYSIHGCKFRLVNCTERDSTVSRYFAYHVRIVCA